MTENELFIRILLAEDNDDDVQLIKRSLGKARVFNKIDVVKDGEEAMAYLKRKDPFQDAIRPGLVILDINMPKMNGFEVLKAIKKDDQLKSLPVVIMTTSDREEDVALTYASGGCSLVRKPMDFEQMNDVAHQFALYWALVAKIPSADDQS